MDIKPLAANQFSSAAASQTVTDVYTNLQGLQGIKNEESQDEALKKVAKQFESLFINMMMKNMRSANAVFEEGNPFVGEEERFYRDLMDQQQALSLSHGRGIGIAESMYRQMSRTYGASAAENETSEKLKTLEDYKANPVVQQVLNSVQATLEQESAKVTQTRSEIAASPEEFVEKLTPFAKKAAEALGVDHLILIAQSALETGWGKHVLSDTNGNSSNNLFNIKANPDWDKASARHTTLEFEKGVFKQEKADFRVYETLADSFDDYVAFISESERYTKAIDVAKDAISYISELKQAGYATDPLYVNKIKAVYQRLTQNAESQGSDRL